MALGAVSGPPAGLQKQGSSSSSLVELVTIVVVALGLALTIQAFLVKPFRIPSESMVPTLQIGQRVLVDRVSYNFSDPHRGDVVVFHPPVGAISNTCGVERGAGQACPRPTQERSDENFIKRIVGAPGDRIAVIDGRVLVNGEAQSEPFINPDAGCSVCDLPAEITVPPGHFFMMGDNRGESGDSRYWGPIPEEWMIGNAFFTYWPVTRIGPL